MLFLSGIFFLGVWFGFMAHSIFHKYFRYDGILVIEDKDEEKTNWTLQVKTDPEDIPKKKSISLVVKVIK